MSQTQDQRQQTGATGASGPSGAPPKINIEVNEPGAPGNQPAAPAPTPKP